MKSIASRTIPFAAVAVSLFALSGVARADALPPDACEDISLVGQSCSVAGPDADQSGTCVASTCAGRTELSDGGFAPASSPCAICEAPDGGTYDGGQATTIRDDGGANPSTPASSSSGCSASPATTDASTGFAMLALGIVGLVLGRRKRA